MKKLFLIFIIFSKTSKCYVQENYGSLHSNYMPSNSVLVNPSSMLDAKTRLDINLGSFAGFFMNNLIYLNKTSVYSFVKSKQYENINDLDFKLNKEHKKYHFYNRTHIQGPSFVFSQGDHAFGIGLNLFSYTDFRKIPQEIILGIATKSVPNDNTFKGKNISFTSMTYGDLKFSYAHTFKKKKRELFMAGISVSKFFPFQATASKINSVEGTIVNDSMLHINSIQADNSYVTKTNVNLLSGFGIDIGFTYQRMLAEAFNYLPNSKRNNCRRNYYLYKLGISIMDIGHLKFKRKKVNYIGVNTENYQLEREDISIDNLNFFRKLTNDDIALRNKDTAFIRSINKVRLPTYLSFQFDYNAWLNKIYLNLTYNEFRLEITDMVLEELIHWLSLLGLNLNILKLQFQLVYMNIQNLNLA